MYSTDNINELMEQERELAENKARIEYIISLKDEIGVIENQLLDISHKEEALRSEVGQTPEDKAIAIPLDAIKAERIALEQKKKDVIDKMESLSVDMQPNDSFEKQIFLSNMQYLLDNSTIKIGQIERDAKCQVGYLSRLKNPHNTSRPSIDFLLSASKLFQVSIDALISVKMTELTETEKVIFQFLERLSSDTRSERIEWIRQTEDTLNHIDSYSVSDYPLFDEHYNDKGTDKPVCEITMNSEMFGVNTSICGDCYRFCMDIGTDFYIMNVCQKHPEPGVSKTKVLEAWMYNYSEGASFLCSNRKSSQLGALVDTLYNDIKESMRRPKLKPRMLKSINSYLCPPQEDLDVEPFN